ncbi:MAG: cupin domain-containing protein [Clostridia bacterium]|nr:cupin domain-containing protein [Clostridia bacterium]NCC42288.1 cupin domain-containing protein [Clostridia bacterium]
MSDSMHEKIVTTEALPAKSFAYASPNQFITNHWHNSLELLYLESGKMDVGINNKTYHLKQGDLIIINSGDIHFTHCRELSKIYVLQVPYPILKAHIPNFDYIRFQSPDGLNLLTGSSHARQLQKFILSLYQMVEKKRAGIFAHILQLSLSTFVYTFFTLQSRYQHRNQEKK